MDFPLFYCKTGSLNAFNVLDRFHPFKRLAKGLGSKVRYTINGHEYNMGYILLIVYILLNSPLSKLFQNLKVTKKIILQMQKNMFEKMFRVYEVLQSQFAMVR